MNADVSFFGALTLSAGEVTRSPRRPVSRNPAARTAEVEDGSRPGVTTGESAEVRELRRRNRLLEQEVEVLRRATAYLSQAHLLGKGSTRS